MVIEALLERWMEERSEALLTRVLKEIARLMEHGRHDDAETAAARASEVTGICITIGTHVRGMEIDSHIIEGNGTRH